MDWEQRITTNPKLAHGKPVIRNTRYSVHSILEYLAGGDSIEDILEAFPDLEKEDVMACLAFASKLAAFSEKQFPAASWLLMRFLLDANIPIMLKEVFKEYDLIHTSELPNSNFTDDEEINSISVDEERVLISKDKDFLESFTVSKRPCKLILVDLGNLRLRSLMDYFRANRDVILQKIAENDLIILEKNRIRVFDQN